MKAIMNNIEKKIDILQAISKGEKALAEGRVITHAEAKKRIAKWPTK